MKKPLIKGMLFALLVTLVASCGSSRKLGCPSSAKHSVSPKTTQA